jgi:aspartate-semialdehyde dehydrogenase
MTLPPNYCRVAIAGASSLRGKDLAAAMEERNFPSTDIRLLDDEVIEGTLTEAAGEPVVIEGVDDESFTAVRFAFFTGSREFTRRHWKQAQRSGATLIDLSGELAAQGDALPFIPALRAKLPPPRPIAGKLLSSPPAAAIISCALLAGLRELPLVRLAITFFQPVTERGQAGVDELEAQTVNLLAMKPITQEVYGAQVAFNLLSRYGEQSKEDLRATRRQVAASVQQYVAGRCPAAAIDLIQVPVFYGYGFSAFAELAAPPEPGVLARALEGAGIQVLASSQSPTNMSVAGESLISVAEVEADFAVNNGCWIWGAADNLRLASSNALSIAETLLAS